jgi:FdhD protein
MEATNPYISAEYYYKDANNWRTTISPVIVEKSVSLTVNGEIWLSFMCTPVDLEAMAVGFLFNEGIIESSDEVASFHLCSAGDNIDIWLSHQVKKPDLWKRTSGCTGGVTSLESIQSDHIKLPESRAATSLLSVLQISDLTDKLLESQDLYRKSGGVHTSVLTDGESTQITGEDIGRHNTLDKIAGKVLLYRIQMLEKILLTTGRISSDMIQKASRIGASVVISRTSPSSLSIEIAQQMGIALIGYARKNRFRIYTHPERVYGFK